jgi:phosphoribosylaminoimidazole-succinocarboxamide synthase
MNTHCLTYTNFEFPGQTSVYHGKVRDVYAVGDLLIMIASDRISAFDVVLPKGIPFKGQVLNQVAGHFLDLTSDIVPNWKIASPDPNVTIGYRCEAMKVEMVIRAYLTGHAWRTYKSGLRTLCGVPLPDGLKEHDKLPVPIITPTTKASEGHDEDISREEIISREIVAEADYVIMEEFTRKLFQRGTELAAKQGLILVDTKYEFGKRGNDILLIDEIHTPDSSRYFYAEGYEARQQNGEQQKQLSKEFVREWLMENGFQGKDGQKIPEMTADFVNLVSARYIELFEQVTGKKFEKPANADIAERIYQNISSFLQQRV